MIKRILLGLAFLTGLAAIAYLLGPHPSKPIYSTKVSPIHLSVAELKKYLENREKQQPVKPGNEARIVFADSLKAQTSYAIIYLHGFGACSEEGNAVHRDIAQRFGCNLLLTRLSDHGLISPEPMKDFTADRLWQSALEYYSMGKILGKKIILMGTSTGGTLALKMAAELPDIAAVILYSPNIEVNNPQATLLNNPWGLQLARKIFHGNELRVDNKDPYYARYWYTHYRLESVVQLQELLETSMTPETFAKVKQPALLLYYYKDSTHQDPVVSVNAMFKMYRELGTPARLKRKYPVPEAGVHVIACSHRSNDVATVEKYTTDFFRGVLRLSMKTD